MSSESLDLLLQNKATLCVLALLESLKTIQASFFFMARFCGTFKDDTHNKTLIRLTVYRNEKADGAIKMN